MVNSNVLSETPSFPESPAFDPDGTLWFVDIDLGELVRVDDDGNQRFDIGGGPSAVTFRRNGSAIICDNKLNRLLEFDPNTETCEVLLDSTENLLLDGPNDLAFDNSGTLVFTCSGDPKRSPEKPSQQVFAIEPDGGLVEVASEMVFPNGLAFTPSGEKLLVAETYAERILCGGWNPDEVVWREVCTWATVPSPVGPDGMAIDGDGRVFVAVYGAGSIWVFDKHGRRIDTIVTPGDNPTNVALDPVGRHGLVVTESSNGQVLAYPEINSVPSSVPFFG